MAWMSHHHSYEDEDEEHLDHHYREHEDHWEEQGPNAHKKATPKTDKATPATA